MWWGRMAQHWVSPLPPEGKVPPLGCSGVQRKKGWAISTLGAEAAMSCAVGLSASVPAPRLQFTDPSVDRGGDLLPGGRGSTESLG